MRYNSFCYVVVLYFSLVGTSVQAALSVNGSQLIYNNTTDTTWSKDANLLGSLITSQGYSVVVSAILVANNGVINDPSYSLGNGVYTLGTADFINQAGREGQTTWWGGLAFINYLNATHYAGVNAWLLPGVPSNAQAGYGHTSGDYGQLFYNELGGVSNQSINVVHNANYSLFSNIQADQQFVQVYWTGDKYAGLSSYAWSFMFSWGGYQTAFAKDCPFYVWPIVMGSVPVPLPPSVTLFFSVLLILIGQLRRTWRQAVTHFGRSLERQYWLIS